MLLMRLSTTFGVTDLAFQWLRFYIIDKFMTFTLNSITSEPKRLDFDVPQDSVLGPFLFVLYTHLLSEIVLDLTITNFLTILSRSTQPLLLI